MRIILLLAMTIWVSGCVAARSTSPYVDQNDTPRRPAEAERLTLKAAAMMKSDHATAERMLREALAMDIFHGPAHNNLGVVYLNQGQIHWAAQEFEWARKLIPGSPDPRVNLALALERAGHTDEALSAYATALEVMPEYIPAIQGLARLQSRLGRSDPELRGRLRQIALRGESGAWREWARHRLAEGPESSSEDGREEP